MTITLLIATHALAQERSTPIVPVDDGRVHVARDIYDDIDAVMLKCMCDDWGDEITDLSDVRDYEDYARWVGGLGLTTRPAGQIFDGKVTVSLIGDHQLGELAAALDNGSLDEIGVIFAEEVVPDIEYTEHVVYYGAGGPNLATAGSGFVLEWIGPAQETWAANKADLKAEFPIAWTNFRYAKETLLYTGLPADDAVNQFANGANALFAFDVRQAPDGPVTGFLMRERRTHQGKMFYVDHWALSDDFEMLGENGGDLAIVTQSEVTYGSLGAWLEAMNAAVPLLTTYARVSPHTFGGLDGGQLAF